jgi:hypothetical protein
MQMENRTPWEYTEFRESLGRYRPDDRNSYFEHSVDFCWCGQFRESLERYRLNNRNSYFERQMTDETRDPRVLAPVALVESHFRRADRHGLYLRGIPLGGLVNRHGSPPGSAELKNEIAQQNEVLCKVLAHNLCVVVASMYESSGGVST